MKREIVSAALTYLDDRFIEEAAAGLSSREEAPVEVKMKKHYPKRFMIAVAAVVLALATAVTAAATAQHGAFFQNIFGKGVEEQKPFALTVEIPGQPTKYEEYPALERAEVDEVSAEKLVGEYVTNVGKSVTVHDLTFSVEDFLVDENGIGMLTFSVSGKDEPNFGYGLMNGGKPVSSRDYPTEDGNYVLYFATFGKGAGAYFEMIFYEYGDLDKQEIWKESILIPVKTKIPTLPLKGNTFDALVSPLGITLHPKCGGEYGETLIEDFVVHFSDGTKYTVYNDEAANFGTACRDSENESIKYTFNRLADTGMLQNTALSGYFSRFDETESLKTPFSDVLIP